MKVGESAVPGVDIYAPDSSEFESCLTEMFGQAPRELIQPALPFSVIVKNRASRTIALLGVRFDMLGPKAKEYSVVHYADTLRNPEKAELTPGASRFVCVEPEYTALVVRGGSVTNTRARMNLDNLRRMLRIRAALDCVAFADGEFMGPDCQGAFKRFAVEREMELALVAEVQATVPDQAGAIEAMLVKAVQDADNRPRQLAARKLLEGLESGGLGELMKRARDYRCRIPLHQASSGSGLPARGAT